MSYNSETSLINYVLKYIVSTFYSEISSAFQILCSNLDSIIKKLFKFQTFHLSNLDLINEKLFFLTKTSPNKT